VFLALPSRLGLDSVLAHQLWSVLLGTISILLVALVGRRIGGPRIGLLAAGLAAVSPGMWLHDGWVMAETLSIFATALAMLATYALWDRPGPARAAALGAAVALAALSRSELLFLWPLLVLPVVWLRRSTAHRPLLSVAAAGCTTALLLAPWSIYNTARFDEVVVLSNQLDRTMAASWCDEGFSGPLRGYKAVECLRRAAGDAGDEEEERAAYAEAWRGYAADHLGEVPAVAVARIGRLLGLYRPGQQLRFETEQQPGPERPILLAAMMLTYVLLALAVVGAVRLGRAGVPRFPVLAPIIVVGASAALTFGQLRYRAPAEPALILLAAATFRPGTASEARDTGSGGESAGRPRAGTDPSEERPDSAGQGAG